MRCFGLLLGLAIACLGASSLFAIDATLTWTAPGNDGTIGQATTYDIRYSVAFITDANWAQATPVPNLPAPKPAGTKESFKVTNLSPATTYYFAIKTADATPNWSALSNIAIKTTCLVSCVGLTGNIDGSTNGIVDLGDLSLLVAYLSTSQTAVNCFEQANVDGSADGVVDLTDLARMVSYMTAGFLLAPCP